MPRNMERGGRLAPEKDRLCLRPLALGGTSPPLLALLALAALMPVTESRSFEDESAKGRRAFCGGERVGEDDDDDDDGGDAISSR